MRKDIGFAVAAVVAVLIACFALASVRPDLPPTPSRPFVAGEHAAAPAKGKKVEGKVVMRINGEPITQKEFELFVLNAPQEARMFYASPQGRRYLAEELVKLKVLEQEAERRGLTDDPETQTQLEMTRAQILAGKALQAVVREGVDKRVNAEYEKQKASSVGLRHILIAYQGGAIPPRDESKPAMPEDEAMKKAQALTAKIRGGADFGQVAMAESDDRESAAQAGSLGAMTLDMLPPEMAAVVKTLKPGQVSDPVKTRYGIHVFKVETPTLEQMRPALQQKLQQEVMAGAVEKLQKGAKVDLDPSYFGQPKPEQPAAPEKGRG